MLGTLNGALEVRGIKLAPDEIAATGTGVNELVDGIVRLTAIHIAYRLRVPAGSKAAVDRALARHQEKCPTAVSLAPAIAIDWTADISEFQAT
ncbi:MAG: OsmC family protein [Gemmatimonadota bacterium]|nr:OsmC family protein [Gemmatimonadota bacterium]